MKRSVQTTALALAIISAAAYLGFVLGKSRNEVEEDENGTVLGEELSPVAKVKFGAVRQVEMEEKVVAFGSVRPLPEDVRTFSLKFDASVAGVSVVEGQAVEKGATLAVLTAAPEAALALSEARDAEDAAVRDLEQAKKRIEMKLGTAQEMITATAAERAARTRLSNLERRAIGKKTISATEDGIVSKVYVGAGQTVASGSPIVETVPMSHIGIVLGVEPSDILKISVGQEVRLSFPDTPDQGMITGHVRLVTRTIDPDSRLVEVFVDVADPSALLMDVHVKGEIVTAKRKVTAVPRNAVLPDGDAEVLFIVKNGKAARLEVKTGLDDGSIVELQGNALGIGQKVVVEGNSVLEDGMSAEAAP
jgi:membrane fusion protein (multidrug efflux system)